MSGDDRLVLISAHGRAGGDHQQDRVYLEVRYLEAFDAWRAQYGDPFKDLSRNTRNRNWDEQLLAGNAAVDYGFELARPAPLAARVGPTFAELFVPYTGIPEGNRSPAFTRA